MSCIQEQGYKVEELLENASESRWRPQYLAHQDGWFFTEHQTRFMTTSTENNNIFLLKNSSHYCQVYLHDWDYFARNVNPSTIPSIELELNDDFAFKIVYLKVKKMELITNCDNSAGHKLSSCVRDYVTRVARTFCEPIYLLLLFQLIGCKMSWDRVSGPGVPICSNTEDFQSVFCGNYLFIQLKLC